MSSECDICVFVFVWTTTWFLFSRFGPDLFRIPVPPRLSPALFRRAQRAPASAGGESFRFREAPLGTGGAESGERRAMGQDCSQDFRSLRQYTEALLSMSC